MTSLRTPLRLETVLAETAWLRRLVRSLVVQRDRAEDVLQETLLVAVKHEGAPIHSVRPWLSRIVHNIVRRGHRRESVRRVVEAERARPHVDPAAVDIVAETEMQQRVTAAALALEEPYRTVILLRFQRGMSYADLARFTGVPVETVRTRIKRGLKRMRSELDANHGGCRAWALPVLGLAEWRQLVPAAGAGSVATGSLMPGSVLPGSVLPGSLMLGGLMLGGTMGKSWLAVIAALAAVCLWAFWPVDSDPQLAKPAEGETIAQPLTAEQAVATDATQGDREEVSRIKELASTTTGSLVVRVVYAEGGQPAAGAGVFVREQSKFDPLFGGRHRRTDASGTVTIRDLDPGPVVVSTDRKQTERPRRTIVAGSIVECTVAVGPGILVSGVVVDEADTPIAGAHVSVGGASSFRLSGPATSSDREGRFALRSLASNTEIHATADGYAPSATHLVLEKDSKEEVRTATRLRLVLGSAGGAIEGRVEGPAGAIVAGAVVQAGAMPRARDVMPGKRITSVPPRLFTARDGTFRFEGLPAGELVLLARAPGLATKTSSCRVIPRGVTRVVVRLDRGVTCEGVVRRHTGEPVRNARVSVGRLGGVMAHFRTMTAEDGSFRLEGLPTDEFEILADAGALGRATAKLAGSDGETIRRDLLLPQVFVLNGRVLTKAGEPLVDASIVVRGGLDGLRRTTTNAEGRFVVEDCPNDVSITVASHNFALARRDNVRPSDGEVLIRVVGKTDAFIKGKVVDATGRPIPGAMVLSLPRRGASFPEHRTDDSGSFTVGPIPVGWYRLLVAARGHARYYSPDRNLVSGETWDAGVIQVAKGGQLIVRLRGENSASGVPSKGLRLQVLDANFRRRTTIRLDAKTPPSTTLTPGQYSLSVTGPSIATRTIPFVVRSGQDTELDVTFSRGVRCTFHIDVPDTLGEFELVRLTIAGARETVQGQWSVRRQGAFDLEYGLAPGSYDVTAISESGHHAESKVVVTNQGDGRFELSVR